MRVSTNMIYDQSVLAMQQQSAALLNTSQQMATGRKLLTPADDPVASAQALQVSQSRAVNEQFITNQGYADDALKLVEGQLSGAGDILQYVRTRVLESGRPLLTDGDRRAIATDLRAQFEGMLAIANSRDANGDYLFAGYQSNDPAFTGNVAGGVTYQGDQGNRTMQVSASRHMPVSLNGQRVFGSDTEGAFFGMARFIQALEDPTSHMPTEVSLALESIDSNMESVLSARAQLGSQQVELEQLTTLGGDMNVQYNATLSTLQDLDYTEAVSRLSLQRTILQASQQSFMQISGLSLFNYFN